MAGLVQSARIVSVAPGDLRPYDNVVGAGRERYDGP